MTYYDNLNVFFRRNEQEQLPPAAQLLMLHLLHKNNCFGNVGTFRCSDRYLQNVTGLSKDGITQAKRHLKNKGYLDFKGDKKQGTLYILKQGTEQGTLHGREQGALQDTYLNKDKDLNNTEKNTRTSADLSVSSDEVIETWEKCKGEKLVGYKAISLATFEKTYGKDTVIKAVITASESNNYNEFPLITFNYFKKVLENQLSSKGSAKSDKRRVNGENSGVSSKSDKYFGEDKFDEYFS